MGATDGSIAARQNGDIAFRLARSTGTGLKRIGRKVIYVMVVIAVLLIIWQFLGSL